MLVRLAATMANLSQILFLVASFPVSPDGPLLASNNVLTVNNSSVCPSRAALVAVLSAAEVATDGGCLDVKTTEFPISFAVEELAAARIAALAARILAVEPKLTGSQLKSRIVSLTTPLPEGSPVHTLHGLIENPSAHYPPK